jgi:hypothetical protein
VHDVAWSLTDALGRLRPDLEFDTTAARVPSLEERVGRHLGGAPWEAFLVLDDLLQELAAGADERLAFQAVHPIVG